MTSMNETISRRKLLASGIGAAMGVCSLGSLRTSPLEAAEPPAGDPNSRMRFGLATYTWGKDWDIPTLIAKCEKAGVYGLELRTSSNYAHGVELTLNASQRAEVKKRFADSPVHVVSIACSERMDWPEPDKLRAAIEAAKAYLQLSRDVGCDVLRVFPNQFHPLLLQGMAPDWHRQSMESAVRVGFGSRHPPKSAADAANE